MKTLESPSWRSISDNFSIILSSAWMKGAVNESVIERTTVKNLHKVRGLSNKYQLNLRRGQTMSDHF